MRVPVSQDQYNSEVLSGPSSNNIFMVLPTKRQRKGDRRRAPECGVHSCMGLSSPFPSVVSQRFPSQIRDGGRSIPPPPNTDPPRPWQSGHPNARRRGCGARKRRESRVFELSWFCTTKLQFKRAWLIVKKGRGDFRQAVDLGTHNFQSERLTYSVRAPSLGQCLATTTPLASQPSTL